MKRFLIFLLFGCSGSVSLAQSTANQPVTYTPAQIERVAKLSELYGHIKFFHPYPGYKSVNWDSAFAATAPLVANAKTDAETVVAIRQLLAVLHDDATTVRLTAKPATNPPATTRADSMQIYFTPDSVLVLKTNNYAGVTDVEAISEKLAFFVRQLPKARAALLDLRAGRVLTDEEQYYFQYALDEVGLERALSAEPFVTAGERLRSHSGFAPERGNSSGGYRSAFYTVSGTTIQPRADAKNCPLAILVNKQTPLTPALFALRSRPHVRFFSTEPLSDAPLVRTVGFPVSETIEVRFRTGELISPDGSIGLAGVPLLPSGMGPDQVQAYLLDQLRISPTASARRSMSGNVARLPVTPAPAVYPANEYPSLGYRLLAGAKIWSVIHYFFAYKELMPTDWNKALRTAVGELAAASDSMQYTLAVAHFYRNIQDGHGFINGSLLYKYAGDGGVAVDIQFVDNQPIIARVYADSVAAKGMRAGDVILDVNGEKIADRIARMSAIQPASNEWTRLYYVRNRLLRSPVGTPIRVKLLGSDGREKTVVLTSQPAGQLQPPPDADTSAIFRLLPGNIGYADLGRLQTKDVARMFKLFNTTKAIIFDMRGYPNGTAWSISPYLTDRPNVVGAKFFRYAPNEPDIAGGDSGGAVQKYFFSQTIPANGGKPVYRGKTVMLIDERTQSQAEHTGLFFEAANGTEFIGSPTAGANGDVTNFGIPGGISLSFSGHDVRHADGRQLQQVGLQPKIPVRPTLSGIRAGHDEVLERAVQYVTTGK
jgi:C-terminal processing protease CtpA/Prc